jgi:uncharacterized protein YutE (UPF0331/DUF86 family)
MRLDLYQAETARIASEQSALLANARAILTQGRPLTPLELSGVLHALQVLVENAIGKAKQLLKARNLNVPISGYDAFSALNSAGLVQAEDLVQWNAAVGLRNRIVHDYMNIETPQIINLVSLHKDQFIVDFLLKEFKEP